MTEKPVPPPKKPKGLTKDERWLWDQVASSKTLDVASAPLLWSLCEAWGLYRGAVAICKSDPSNKAARINAIAYWTAFCRASKTFGLGPADRAKVGAPLPAAAAIPAAARVESRKRGA